MKEAIPFLLTYLNKLESNKTMWNSVWQEINDYILPFKRPILYDDLPGTQRSSTTIYDSTATHAVFRLAAALNSLLTNPTSKWFALETDDDVINKEIDSQRWFEDMSNVIMRALENSNFYTEVNEMYIDLVSYGTGILYVEPSSNPDKDLVFSARSVKEVSISENKEGLIDVVARKFKLTARQVIEEFGEENASEEVKKAMQKDPETNFEILHFVFPRDELEIGKYDKQNKKYASIWIEKEKQQLLRKSGYDTFPFIVSRWLNETGEIYGRSPAMNSLPDIKTLNEMVKTLLMTGQKIADPPIQVPDEGFGDISTQPGKIMYYDPTYKSRVEPLIFGANLPITFDMVSEKRHVVADAFYMNQLLLIDKRELTAEEVRARQSENARILAPTFGMLNYEFLSPLIERVIDILSGVFDYERKPLLPIAPVSLRNKKYRLKFISPLAKSQRIHEVQSISHTVATAIQWGMVRPEVLDNIDWDRAIRTVADVDGSPASVLMDEKNVATIRALRAQQQAAMLQAQLAQQSAETFTETTKGAKNVDKIRNK